MHFIFISLHIYIIFSLFCERLKLQVLLLTSCEKKIVLLSVYIFLAEGLYSEFIFYKGRILYILSLGCVYCVYLRRPTERSVFHILLCFQYSFSAAV